MPSADRGHGTPPEPVRPPADLAVIIPARNEADRVGATVAAAAGLAGVDLVIVVDDGSIDRTAAVASAAGARVVRHSRNRGKAAAMETGAEAVRLLEPPGRPHHLLFLDADLGDSAANAGPLAAPIRDGTADMTIATSNWVRIAGHGLVLAVSGAGIARATGWRPAQPMSGQRCLTRAAFDAALPLASRFGAETGLTIDLHRKGMRIAEVGVPLSHRATGRDWRSQLHRARQLADVGRALAVRELRASRYWRRPGVPGG
jgi:hypothetical protein